MRSSRATASISRNFPIPGGGTLAPNLRGKSPRVAIDARGCADATIVPDGRLQPLADARRKAVVSAIGQGRVLLVLFDYLVARAAPDGTEKSKIRAVIAPAVPVPER